MNTLDLTVISLDAKFQTRAAEVAQLFAFSFIEFESADSFFEKAECYKLINCIVIDCCKIEKPNEAAGMVQVACQIASKSYIIVVLNSKLRPEDTHIVKASGASLVMMENEYFYSSKLEFVTSQVIRSAFVPVKTLDLIPDSEIDFPLYHLMPVNKKFLKVAKPGHQMQIDFLEKFSECGELYLHRSDLQKWIDYNHSFESNDSLSSMRKCRLHFLQLNQSFLKLVLMISDQSAGSSFGLGRELFANCESFAGLLLDSLIDVKDPWLIINGSAVGDFGSLERAPAIAAYAGLLSSQAKLGNAKELMIGALLADVGYLELSPSTSRKIRENKLEDLHSEEKMEYEKHPIYSLNQCLSRRLPFPDSIKNMILQSHERMDQKGFPNRINPDKLTQEAMLIRLCWQLDNVSQIRMGAERRPIHEVKRDFIEDVFKMSGEYSISFLTSMRSLILAEPTVTDKNSRLIGKVQVQ